MSPDDKRSPRHTDHTRSTPTGGVPKQRAPSESAVPEEFEGEDDTPVGGVVPTSVADARLRGRVKETNQATREIKDTVSNQSSSLTSLDQRVTVLATGQEQLNLKMVKVETSLDKNTEMTTFVRDKLVEALAVDRKITLEDEQHIRRKTFEVNTHERMTEIDDASKDRAVKRKIKVKQWGIAGALLGSGGLIATVILALVSKC